VKISQRIGGIFKTEDEFKQYSSFLFKYIKCIDELSIFADLSHHGYYTMEFIKKVSASYKEQIKYYKDMGFKSVGINILCTLGHMDEAWDWLSKPPFQTMVGHDGEISKSCLCPNTQEYKEYMSEKYRLYAMAEPDFIWVDDDVRTNRHGVDVPCFCPTCISIFNKNNNTDFTRETLVKKLNSLDGMHYREKWVEQNINTIDNVMEIIEKSVHTVNKEIQIGFMSIRLTSFSYLGHDFDRWMKTLNATKLRPGEDFYDDSTPMEFMYKVLECERQVSVVPKIITDIQYELENFPYQKLSKSLHSLILECTASLMTGMNGIAFNAINGDNRLEIMDEIQKFLPLWRNITEITVGYHNKGFYPALSQDFEGRSSVENWLESKEKNTVLKSYVLNEIGIPLTMEADSNCGVILVGSMAEGFTKEELKLMLSKGVFLDGKALQILCDKGLGEYCGVSIKEIHESGISEQLTHHPLNSNGGGIGRDICISFSNWAQDRMCYVFELMNEKVEILSDLMSLTRENLERVNLGPTFTVYENSLGGRVAVHGYAAWNKPYSENIRKQYMDVCDWLSQKTMPLRIEKCLKVIPFIRVSEDDKHFILMLVNGSFDATGEFDVEIRVPRIANLFELKKDGRKETFLSDRIRGGIDNTVLKIRSLVAWDFIIVASD
jgi:hypothetical protein